jgi:hypothetical protein
MAPTPKPTGPAPSAIERDGRLTGYRYLPSTKAYLLSRLGASN